MLTACGIETRCLGRKPFNFSKVATVLTACGIETQGWLIIITSFHEVATVLTACGIETRYFGFNRDTISCNSAYRLRYWNSPPLYVLTKNSSTSVATALTVCSMRRRVRGSRGAKRRWRPHISSPWPKGRENKGDKVTALTACGIETCAFLQSF